MIPFNWRGTPCNIRGKGVLSIVIPLFAGVRGGRVAAATAQRADPAAGALALPAGLFIFDMVSAYGCVDQSLVSISI